MSGKQIRTFVERLTKASSSAETSWRLLEFFINNQKHKNDISVKIHLAYLLVQFFQNVEERNS